MVRRSKNKKKNFDEDDLLNDDLFDDNDVDIFDNDDIDDSDLSIFSEDGDIFNEDIEGHDTKSSSKKRRSKNKKKSSTLKKFLIPLIIISLIGGLGYYSIQKGWINIDNISSHQSERNNQEQEEFENAEPAKNVTLQLVNTEQVFWAENVCDTMSHWGEESLKEVPPPEREKGYTSGSAADEIVKVLHDNANILRKRATEMQDSIPNSYKTAQEFEKDTILTDNNKTVGQSPDSRITNATSNINISLKSYADGLDSMANDLKSKASYDFNGQRDTISMISQALDGMEDELGNMLSKEINDSLFENTVTMERVAQLGACNGTVISGEELDRQRGEEISEQETIRNYVNYKRCEYFMSDRQRFGGSEFVSSEEACNKVLKESTFTGDDPVSHWNINTQNAERAKPANIPDDVVNITSNDEEENNDSSNNNENDYDNSSRSSIIESSEEESSKSTTDNNER